MSSFKIETFIKNKPEVIFNLSRSIDLHLISTSKTNEKAITGVTTGLINLHESVTWEANHLFKKRYFTSKITAYNFPFSFTDEMQKGDLKSFSHQHIFEAKDDGTLMTDIVYLEAPFGLLGKFVLWLFLKSYFKTLLTERNEVIKEYAENEQWKLVLNEK